MPDSVAIPIIVAGVVLAILFAKLSWKLTDPTKPRWAFWVVLILACTFIGFAIGFTGMHVVTKFLS